MPYIFKGDLYMVKTMIRASSVLEKNRRRSMPLTSDTMP